MDFDAVFNIVISAGMGVIVFFLKYFFDKLNSRASRAELNELKEKIEHADEKYASKTELNELKKSISDNHVSIIYENDEGYLLSFTYTRNRESVSVYSEYQGTDVQTVIVGDNAADLYLDQREGNTNTLIWSDEEKSAIFVISAHCSSDELIKIAESVEAVQ